MRVIVVHTDHPEGEWIWYDMIYIYDIRQAGHRIGSPGRIPRPRAPMCHVPPSQREAASRLLPPSRSVVEPDSKGEVIPGCWGCWGCWEHCIFFSSSFVIPRAQPNIATCGTRCTSGSVLKTAGLNFRSIQRWKSIWMRTWLLHMTVTMTTALIHRNAEKSLRTWRGMFAGQTREKNNHGLAKVEPYLDKEPHWAL
jgi:hypothetical protein